MFIRSGAKLVMAHTTSSGEARYALCEKGADGRMGCIGYGSLKQVLALIFEQGRLAEYGLLRGSGGGFLTAQGLIRQWMGALSRPQALASRLLLLDGYSFKADPESGRKAIDAGALLRIHNLGESANELASKGSTILNLFEDDAVIASLCNAEGYYDSSRVHGAIRTPDVGAEPLYCPELAYKPKPYTGPAIELPRALMLDEGPGAYRESSGFLVQTEGGRWKLYCAPWQAMGEYVAGLASQELKAPKTYTRQIAGFRKLLAECGTIDSSMLALVVPTQDAEHILGPLESMGDAFLERGADTTRIVPKAKLRLGRGILGQQLKELQDCGGYWTLREGQSGAA